MPDFIVVLFKMRLIKMSIIIIIIVGGLCGSDLSGLSTGLLWIAIEWHCNCKWLIDLNKFSVCLSIKQAMTFYKILNNIIEINPPTGLLTRSHNRHHFTIHRSRLNTVVYSFYPRAIRIWNKIPKEITEIKQPESFHAAISKLPFTTPTHLKCL